MKCRMTLFVVFWAVAMPAFGQIASAPARAKAAEDQIARESDVQTRVSDEMAHLVREFGDLVDDVKSNQVSKQADAGTLEGMKKSLESTDKNRVRVAASELRKAVDNDSSRSSHVKEAAVQVNHATTELTNLLRQANWLMLEDTILQAIQEIIRDQQGVAHSTARTGREQLQQQPLSADPVQLAQGQRQIVKRVKRLKETMQQALLEELADKVRERLQQAQKIGEEKLLEQKVLKAVDDLDKVDMTDAFQEQQQALAILAEMADAISDIQRPASDADMAALKKLLADQTELRKKTESLSPSDFQNAAAQLQLDQLNLAKELPQTPKDSPESSQTSKAADKMAEAANNLEKIDQKAAVAEQMEAEAALGKAIEEGVGPGPGVPGAKGDAGTDDKGDGDSDKDEEGRGNDGKGKKGKGKKPGPPKPDSEPGDQEPKENTEPDENAAIVPALAKNMPTRSKVEPKAGERLFEKTKVEGKIPQGSDSTWTSLSRKERESLSENFARELPREYRDMLKVYFEELSK